MKKSLLLLLLFPLVINAQETDRKLRFGLKVAPLFSWIKPDFNTEKASNDYSVEGGGLRLGFNWGPSVEIVLNETFLLSTGLDINYSSGRLTGRSRKINLPVVNYDWEQVYKTRFIELPLMIKGRTKEIGHLRYFMQFGLSAGFRYRGNFEFTEDYGQGVKSVRTSKESSTYINSFRGALLVGGGVEYNLSGNTSLVMSIMFNNGLTNLLKEQFKDDIQNGDSITDDFNLVNENGINNHLMLNVGILF